MKNNRVILILCLLLIPIITFSSNYDFHQFRYDQQNSGMSLSLGPRYNADVLWAAKVSHGIISAPVSNNGILFFGDLSNQLFAVDGETGNYIWHKQLQTPDSGQIGIYGSPAIYGKSIVVATGNGEVYSFDQQTGQQLWGPVNVQESVYSSLVVADKLLFITTAKKGLLWILDASTGKEMFKFPIQIGSAVHSTLVAVGNYVHIAVPTKVITYKIDLKAKKYQRLKDIPIKGSVTSSPIFYDSRLYLATKELLYSIHLESRKVLWAKKIKQRYHYSKRITYPSPTLHKWLIFYGSRGYQIDQGKGIWYFWSYGNATTDSIATTQMIYLGGDYTLYKKHRGFVAGINIANEGVVFWLNFNKPVITPIILANRTLYFATEDNILYAVR